MTSKMVHARRYTRRDGATVRAMPFDGRVAGLNALLAAFPGRVLPHPHRDDAVLVRMDSGRPVRIGADDWVVEAPGGALETWPDDQFHIRHHLAEAVAA